MDRPRDGKSPLEKDAMGVWDDLKANIRRIILMEERIDGLTKAVDRLADQSLDHERRLIRIETMIEMAQDRAGRPPKPRIEG
jgi:hypothetical protein